MTSAIIAFKGKQIEITKDEYDTFVSSITTQNPTKAELGLYFYDCDRRGVHPLDKLIYFTKRKGRYVPIVGIDYMRIRAESSGVYAGSDDAVFTEDNEFPVSATVTVWKMVEGRLGRFSATARWDEYKPDDLAAAASFMWKKMPHTMLAKCAEALALRKAFPGQLAGLYAAEEMAQDNRYVEARNTVAQDAIEQESQEVVDKPIKAVGKSAPAEEASDGWTVKEILGNKQKQMEDLIHLTGKKPVEIVKFLNTLDHNRKYSLIEIERSMTQGED